MIRERILFRLFFSLLPLLSFSPFCTYEPTFQIPPNDDSERKDDDRNIALMYVIDGAVGYDSVMKQVASQLEHEIEALKTDYRVQGVNTVLDYNYVVSVSADTITLTGDHDKSVTVVAVNVARNLGE